MYPYQSSPLIFCWLGLVVKKRLILTFTSGLLLMLSSATLTQSTVLAQNQTAYNTPMVQAASAAVLSSTSNPALIEKSASTTDSTNVETYVREYFAKTPILAEIARCESRFHQFGKSGNVIHGQIDPDDIGVMQINSRYNGDDAKKLGYDIYTLDGNLGFGQWLYDHEGTQPWTASESCWSK